MSLTDELRKLVGTSEMEPVLWQLEPRQLAHLHKQIGYVLDIQNEGKPYIRGPILQEAKP